MTDERHVEYRGSGFYVSVVLIVLIGGLLFVFALQNTETVNVSLFAADVDMPLFGVAIGAGLITLVLGELVGLVWRRQRRRRLTERRELEELRAATPSSVSEPYEETDEEVPSVSPTPNRDSR